jgi:Dolichyl-phosphate-mannose-protein mannosyltransferase
VGVTQSTLGFNQPHFDADDPIPTPLTHQPPLYPLMIAAVSQTGLSITDSALLISVVSYAFALLAGYRVILLLFGETEALGALLLLAAYAPLRNFSDSAFSDPPGIAMLFSTFWLLARYAKEPEKRARQAFLAGCIAGVGVATRYALAPLVAIGALFVFIRASDRIRDSVLFMVGPGVLGILLVWRNLNILHGSVMPHYLHSRLSYLKNASDALSTLLGDYADWISQPVRIALLAVAVLVALAIAQRRQQWVSTLAGVCWLGAGPMLLVTFGLVYTVFLIIQHTHAYIDPIGPRYMLPATVTFLLLFAVFAVRATGVNLNRLAVAGSVIAMLLIAYEVDITLVTPVYSADRLVAASERLAWVEKNTTNDDLIIGQDAVAFPFYFGRTVAVSYSPFPFTEVLPYDKTLQLCRRFKPLYARILLVIPRHPTPFERANINWLSRLGPFIEAANFGRADGYPAINPGGGVEGWTGFSGHLLRRRHLRRASLQRLLLFHPIPVEPVHQSLEQVRRPGRKCQHRGRRQHERQYQQCQQDIRINPMCADARRHHRNPVPEREVPARTALLRMPQQQLYKRQLQYQHNPSLCIHFAGANGLPGPQQGREADG